MLTEYADKKCYIANRVTVTNCISLTAFQGTPAKKPPKHMCKMAGQGNTRQAKCLPRNLEMRWY